MFKKILCGAILGILCCSTVLAAPAGKVCVEVRAVSGYDSPDVGGDGWYGEVYKMAADELNRNGVVTENANDTWSEFVLYTKSEKSPKTFSLTKEIHQSYNEFRKNRFDQILEFQTVRYVTFDRTGISDIAMRLVVKDSKNADGEPLAVYTDSKTGMKNVNLKGELSTMVKNLVKRWETSKL